MIIIGGVLFVGQGHLRDPQQLEGEEGHGSARVKATLGAILLDRVFSLDSMINAVGMVDELGVMIAAVVIADGVMIVSAGAISSSSTATLR